MKDSPWFLCVLKSPLMDNKAKSDQIIVSLNEFKKSGAKINFRRILGSSARQAEKRPFKDDNAKTWIMTQGHKRFTLVFMSIKKPIDGQFHL
jgi:hypothetical protein